MTRRWIRCKRKKKLFLFWNNIVSYCSSYAEVGTKKKQQQKINVCRSLSGHHRQYFCVYHQYSIVCPLQYWIYICCHAIQFGIQQISLIIIIMKSYIERERSSCIYGFLKTLVDEIIMAAMIITRFHHTHPHKTTSANISIKTHNLANS